MRQQPAPAEILAQAVPPVRQRRVAEAAPGSVVEIEDNNLVLLEFATGTLAVAAGSNCRGSVRIPWGGMGLYGTDGALEITEERTRFVPFIDPAWIGAAFAAGALFASVMFLRRRR